MVIFLLISAALILCIHKFVMSTVENYEYGFGTHEEWREFERQFRYEDAIKF
jgi:hypothetical protein